MLLSFFFSSFACHMVGSWQSIGSMARQNIISSLHFDYLIGILYIIKEHRAPKSRALSKFRKIMTQIKIIIIIVIKSECIRLELSFVFVIAFARIRYC